MEPAHIGGFGAWNLEVQMGLILHNEAHFYDQNGVTFIFILALEEKIQKMPDICLCLITPSLFHITTWYTCLWKGLDKMSMMPLRL